MKKLLSALLCIGLLLVPGLAHAAGDYISSSDISSEDYKKLKSMDEDVVVDITVGKVHMIKYVSGDFVVLSFLETDGFTNNTYKSILTALDILVRDEYYSYFQGKYPSISSDENISFPGFRIKRNPEKLSAEREAFGEDAQILRVEICTNDFDDLLDPEDPTNPNPTPTPTPTPTSTPDPEVPTSGGSGEIENPSTGDLNVVVLGAVTLVAILGIGLSIKKIHE